jgi:hypothetical protein
VGSRACLDTLEKRRESLLLIGARPKIPNFLAHSIRWPKPDTCIADMGYLMVCGAVGKCWDMEMNLEPICYIVINFLVIIRHAIFLNSVLETGFYVLNGR